MNKRVSRKRFLTGALGVGGGLAVLGLSGGCGKKKRSTSGRVRSSLNYSLEAFMDTDPELDMYREMPNSFALRQESPRCLAVDCDGRIYVGGDRCVDVYAAAGSTVARWTYAATPTAIHARDDGRVIVATQGGFEVRDVDGNVLVSHAGEGHASWYTCISSFGELLFLADARNKCVRVFNMQGRALRTIKAGKTGDANGRFVIPSPYFDIAASPDGLLTIANTGKHQLETYTTEGQLVSAWGEASMGIEGFAGCCNPADFLRLKDGRFVTSEKGLNRIKIHSADGALAGVVASPRALIKDEALSAQACRNCNVGYSLDLAADRHNTIYALDPATRSVRVFSPLSS